ncbi:hypothetical protein RSSM_06645 [Rhodopirellula sallentina SM41]|uniref:Uncharacterized protein n=1 Tax=Rhodopirellula sallentina SM41 TaxID=1263870 RepID=M5U7I1_9BACT|nr:hypothetical protein RSSM_06645 [Rhodopirellula sallentina SM41]
MSIRFVVKRSVDYFNTCSEIRMFDDQGFACASTRVSDVSTKVHGWRLGAL